MCNTHFDVGNLVDIDVGVVMSNEKRTWERSELIPFGLDTYNTY